MKRFFKPKRIAIISLVFMGIALSVFFLYHNSVINYLEETMNSLNVSTDLMDYFYISRTILMIEEIYIIIYLSLLLLGKAKKYKSLNVMLIVVSGLSILNDPIWSIFIISYTTKLIYNIKKPSKTPIKVYSIIFIISMVLSIMSILIFFSSNEYMPAYSIESNVIPLVLTNYPYQIGKFFFTIFMYQCALSFYKGGVNNEQ